MAWTQELFYSCIGRTGRIEILGQAKILHSNAQDREFGPLLRTCMDTCGYECPSWFEESTAPLKGDSREESEKDDGLSDSATSLDLHNTALCDVSS